MCIIYHNPKCSKSRKALELLENKNIKLEIREYLKTGLTLDEINQIKELLQEPISAFMRKKEDLFIELNLATASEDELMDSLSKHPKLLERPIVIRRDKAVIARPAELLEELFSNN